jgi:hypothetical protein
MATITIGGLVGKTPLTTDEIEIQATASGASNKATLAAVKTLMSASPTLVTPDLGTPSAGVLTNCTGLPVAGGGTGRATGTTAYALIATGTTATGAQQSLAAGATTEVLVGGGAAALPVWTTATGSGAPVRATSPTLVTPALGTPSSGTLTNCTGLPVAGGGTGRATSTTAYGLIAAGTTATGAHQTLAAGATTDILVGGGASALPAWTTATGSGAPVRATSPTLVTPVLGVATGTSFNGLTITTSTGTLTITNGKTASFSNTLTFTGTDSSSVAFGTGGTVAYANATVTLSASTDLTRASHGNRLIIADTAAITLTVLDDTAGGYGSGDVLYGVNTSAGVVTLAADATGTTTTVTAGPGMTLSVPPGQEFSLFRTAANVWRGGAQDDGLQQNSQSTAYTTVWADRNKHILHPTADNNARTFTIDSNANVPYPTGTTLTFVNQINTVTIAITSDTLTLAGAGTTGSRTLAANGIATAIKVSSTGWVINGTGLT